MPRPCSACAAPALAGAAGVGLVVVLSQVVIGVVCRVAVIGAEVLQRLESLGLRFIRV